MLVESGIWVVAGLAAPSYAGVARAVQISPSLAASGVGATVAAAALWLAVTFFAGRVYCSSVCPIGTLQDIVIRLRRSLPGARPFRYKRGNSYRFAVLGAYVASFVVVIGCVPLLFEPWPAFVNMVSRLSGAGEHHSLVSLGVGAAAGLVCAFVSLLFPLLYALVAGRDFCNDVCPIGTILRPIGSRAVMHIELYPDRCTSCLKCQDVCKASCIDIKTRTIDNGRCVRCFNCVNVCDEDAIRFTVDRNGVITALFQRRSQLSN